MRYLTYQELDSLRKGDLREDIVTKIAASVWRKGKTVFLAHSNKDARRISPVVNFFKDFDASVYVDVQDNELKQPPTAETAQVLRERIRDCLRFVILVSPHSYASKWIPWELGVADGNKGVASIALLPITPDNIQTNWVTTEYLGIYPRIVYSAKHKSWRVYDPRDKSSWVLETWLHDDVE